MLLPAKSLRILAFTAVLLGALASQSAFGQRPDVRPHFDDISFGGILIAIDGRGAWHHPEPGENGKGPWLVNGEWSSDRIMIYDATPRQVSALTGTVFRGTSRSLNTYSMLVAEFQDKGGKTIQVEWIYKYKVTYVAVDTHNGDDYVEVTTNLDCWIELGSGYDIAVGGSGNDYLENTNGRGKLYGGLGNNTMVGNVTGGGLFAPSTYFYGDVDVDTYIFNYDDWIHDTLDGDVYCYAWNGGITPNDFTYSGGRYKGMSQLTMTDEFLADYCD